VRLIVTNGAQAVDITVKGGGVKALIRAEKVARRLMRQSAKTAATTQPFGFTVRSDTALADTDE
jgi:hypothetical protein